MLLVVLALLAQGCGGGGWRAADGRRLPDTEARRTSRGFSGVLVVTPDADWREKLNVPSSTVPVFNEAHTLRRGEQLTVLTFFANPGLRQGAADVTCDIDITKPDGSAAEHRTDAPGFAGPVPDPRLVTTSASVLEFVGESGDPPGRWQVRVTLHDNVRRVSLPLRTSFVLE